MISNIKWSFYRPVYAAVWKDTLAVELGKSLKAAAHCMPPLLESYSQLPDSSREFVEQLSQLPPRMRHPPPPGDLGSNREQGTFLVALECNPVNLGSSFNLYSNNEEIHHHQSWNHLLSSSTNNWRDFWRTLIVLGTASQLLPRVGHPPTWESWENKTDKGRT